MAVYSETDIANRALSKLGDARIIDITQPVNAAGRAMQHRFPFVRDYMLQTYPWRFAMALASLAADATPPAWGYAKRYRLPDDLLRLVTLGDTSIDIATYGVQYRVGGETSDVTAAAFEVIGPYIHTDLSAPLRILYVTQITDTGEFPDVFSEALAVRLAFDACEELTQSATKKDALASELKMVMTEARRVDALQRPPAPRAPGNWSRSRLG